MHKTNSDIGPMSLADIEKSIVTFAEKSVNEMPDRGPLSGSIGPNPKSTMPTNDNEDKPQKAKRRERGKSKKSVSSKDHYHPPNSKETLKATQKNSNPAQTRLVSGVGSCVTPSPPAMAVKYSADTPHKVRFALRQIIDSKGCMPKSVAKDFIACSAIWLTHVGGPCSAPGHADRIKGTERDWTITFGANIFHITKAIDLCRRTIEDCIHCWSQRHPVSLIDCRERLRGNFQAAVANTSGRCYHRYPLSRNNMVFGATALDSTALVREFIRRAPVQDLCGATSEAYMQIMGMTKPSDAKPSKHSMVMCPYCNEYVRNDRLPKHIDERCRATRSIAKG